MTRRRRGTAEANDSLDLLLDTVSNVFGGVMFLTLLAALMILSRGASSMQPETVDEPPPIMRDPVDDRIVQMELEQVSEAIESQESVMKNLPSDPDELQEFREIRNVESLLENAKAELRQSQKRLADAKTRADSAADQQAKNEASQEALAETLASKQKELERADQVGKRSIAFRPLRMATSTETILILRYGKVYLFQKSPISRSFNDAEFFAIGNKSGSTLITPKPHRGTSVTPKAMSAYANQLRSKFPPHAFHVTIAVWDDSFGQFNTLADALQDVGYRYRTIPCNDEAKLSFGSSASPWVQ